MAGVTIADVGGIQANIGEIQGDELTLYPVVGESSACPDTRQYSDDPSIDPDPDPDPNEDALPMLRAGVGGATVPSSSNLSFTKDIRTPDITKMAGVRVGVTRPPGAGKLQLGDASIEFTRLDAEQIDLQTDLLIEERNDTHIFGDPYSFDPGSSFSDPGGEFIFEGQTANIQNAEAVVHFVAFSNLSVPDLKLTLEYIENDFNVNADDPDSFCPVRGSGVFVSILDITDQSGSSDIDAGDTLVVDFEAFNPGDSSESSTIYLDFGTNSGVNSTFISLNGGEVTNETLTYDIPSGQSPGEYNVTVRSDDNDDERFVKLGDNPFFNVTINNTTSPVEANKTLLVNATVENTGDFADTQDIELDISDGVSVVDTKTVSLNGSEAENLTLEWKTNDNDIGNYTANVTSEDDTDNTSVKVISEDPYFEINILGTNSPVVEGENMTFDFKVENLGQNPGTQEINLGIIQGGSVYENSTDNITLTLNSGESRQETLVWDTDRGDLGEFTGIINSTNTTDDVDVFVEEEIDAARVVVIGEDQNDRAAIQQALENWLDPDRFSVENRTSTALLGSTASYIDTYDAFVVNKYDEGEWTDDDVGSFLDNAKANGSKVVSLENAPFGIDPDAITRRSNATGYNDPDSIDYDTSGNETIVMDILQDHPIFEDPNFVGTSGDTVDVYIIDGFADRAWFSGFSDGDVYGEIYESSKTEPGGPGAGVTVDENEVLLSLGHTTWFSNYTDNGEKILANSVAFLVGPEPAFFDVEIDDTNSPVDEGDTFLVNTTVRNTGELQDTQNVTLEISDGVGQVDSKSVSLRGGNNTSLTLEWNTSRGDGGTYTATVSSENDSETSSFAVGDDVLGSVLVAGTDDTQYGPIRDFLDARLDDNKWIVDQDDSTDLVLNSSDYIGTYDTFVINSYDRSTLTATDIGNFLDDVDANDLGIVQLENWGTGSDAITGRVDARGNPDSVEDSYDNSGPVELEIAQDDPIFDGVGTAGDRVQVYEASFGDRAWFLNYSGPTLGEVVNTSDGTLDGPGASRENNHCLLSLGNQSFVDGYLADGEQIITNCVTEVNPFPPIFEVNINSTNSPVSQGDNLTVDVDVKNVGDETGTQDIVLDIDGIGQQDTQSVTLDPGVTKTVTLEWNTSGVAENDYTANVSSEDDFDTSPVTVGEAEDLVLVAGTSETQYGPIRDFLDTRLSDTYIVEQDDVTKVVDDPVTYADTYDVFVMNAYNRSKHDGTDISNFLDEVDSQSRGIVQLENWGTGSDAITGRVDARGNPSSVQDSYDNSGPVELEITQDSPIFNGVGTAGDRVQVYNASFGDRAWFNGYSGPTLGEVVNTSDGTLDGPGASVEGNHCLLSLGNQSFIDGYLTNGEKIIANCVGEVTPEPANFNVTNFRYYVNEVADNQTVRVWADIENVGTENGTDTIEYRMGGTTYNSTDLNLTGGETQTVNFTHTVNETVGDTVTHGVYSTNDSNTTNVNIVDKEWSIPTTTDTFDDAFHHQRVTMKQNFTGEITVRAMSGSTGFANAGEVQIWTTNASDGADTLLWNESKSAGQEFVTIDADLTAGETYQIGHTNGSYRHNEGDSPLFRTGGTYTDVVASYYDYSGSDIDSNTYGFSEYDMGQVDANITDFTQLDTGNYSSGDVVEANVTFENTGETTHEFFVGYSVRDPNGTFYDNDGSTGTTATVAPGDTATVTVNWTVESDAPDGDYDSLTSVWLESDRNNLRTQLDNDEITNAFAVEQTGYILPPPGDTSFEWIERVKTDSFDFTSGNNSGYADFTNLTADVVRGGELRLTHEAYSGGFTQEVSVWVDWDQDINFTENERVYLGACSGSPTCTLQETIDVPDNASLGNTRMRIIQEFGNEPTDPYKSSEDENTWNGEAEDYNVSVSDSNLLFTESFESAKTNDSGSFGRVPAGWESFNNASASANTSNSRSYSGYTCCETDSRLESPSLDLSSESDVAVDYWVRKGGSFSENPESGEDLIVEYLDNGGVWQTLEEIRAADYADGEIIEGDVAVPDDGLHSGFQLRFRQTGGSGDDFDYWHVDDIVVKRALLAESFESGGSVPSGWSAFNSAGVDSATNNSDSYSAYTCCEADSRVESPSVDLSSESAVAANYWVRKGGSFSENPESGEDLIVEYLDSGSSWSRLSRINASNYANGEVIDDIAAIPDDGLHSGFQIRFRQTGGSGSDFDYWHVDDVVLERAPLAEAFDSGSVPSGWSAFNSAGVNSDMSSSEIYAGYTCCETDSRLESPSLDLSGEAMMTAEYWIRKGNDSYSNTPESGEDVVIEYLDSSGTWTTIETFTADGVEPKGKRRSGTDIPLDELHSGFQLRARGTGGSGSGFDYWHIDDVVITRSGTTKP